MSDDIARQRFWSENRAKADSPVRANRIHRGRSAKRSLSRNTEPTHVLMVRKAGHREWCIIADRASRGVTDVSGSEATRARHWPDDEFRVWPLAEATKELKRKTWSVRDVDHIKNGERVLLRAEPDVLHPSLGKMREVFGVPGNDHRKRTGTVRSRHRRTGHYMVHIDGGGLSVSVGREDLICPVPDNVLVFEGR